MHQEIKIKPRALVTAFALLLAILTPCSSALANYYQPPPVEEHWFTAYPSSVTRDFFGTFHVLGKYANVSYDLPVNKSELIGHGWVCTGDTKMLMAATNSVDQKLLSMVARGKGALALKIRIARQRKQDPLEVVAIDELSASSPGPNTEHPALVYALNRENSRKSSLSPNLWLVAGVSALACALGFGVIGRRSN